ncbi:hypothetical protein ACFXPJ_40725, partial [Streptomyces goshikiensis]
MKYARRLVAGTLAAGALALSLSGCGKSVDPIERMGRKASQEGGAPGARAPPPPPPPPPGGGPGGAVNTT